MTDNMQRLSRTIAQIRSTLVRAIDQKDIESQARLLGYLAFTQTEYIRELEKELYHRDLVNRYAS